MKEKLQNLKSASVGLENRKVLYLIWKNPWMTVSNTTYISKMLELIRWRTVPSNKEHRYPEVTEQEIVDLDFDFCLLSSEPYPFKSKHVDEIQKIRGNKGETILVDGEKLSWYGSRVLKGIDYLFELSTSRLTPGF